MDLEIPESLVEILRNAIATGSPLARRLDEHGVCRGGMVVSSTLFDAETLNLLFTLSKTLHDRTLMFQMLALDNIHGAPQARRIPSLELLVPGLVAYFSRGMIDGWLYKRNKDGVLLPWLIHRMRHVIPAEGAGGSPYVVIDLMANTMESAGRSISSDQRMRRSGMTNAILIDANDIAHRTIPELLADRGYYKECAEFKHEYEAHVKRFSEMQPRFGTQFVARTTAFLSAEKPPCDLVPVRLGASDKCINDEESLERRIETVAESSFWRTAGVSSGFEKVPLHCYVHLYHLELHRNIWVHVQNLSRYEYNPALRDKLILPQQHRDLIDILTADMDVLLEDFVKGKSGGTTILCKGAPGLGKTLTAEVYAEVVGKPLYRVHSGLLGTNAQSVEQNLTGILRRAERWGAILLLDEADVYIRCRDNDLQHNAIVAEFLRTLEHFSGLLFMTTNRVDDVDDAILSRCIAVIHYRLPEKDDAARIWKALAAQFHAELPDDLVERLTDTYSQASGRDIKELLKLTTKFCKGKNIPLSEQAFSQCAVFRGHI